MDNFDINNFKKIAVYAYEEDGDSFLLSSMCYLKFDEQNHNWFIY